MGINIGSIDQQFLSTIFCLVMFILKFMGILKSHVKCLKLRQNYLSIKNHGQNHNVLLMEKFIKVINNNFPLQGSGTNISVRKMKKTCKKFYGQKVINS